jgi:chemotaxis protein MotB
VGTYRFFFSALFLIVLVGCEASDHHRDLEYRVNKAEGERDQARLALDDERAKVAILQERLAKRGREQEIMRAELNLLRERSRQLEQDNSELLAVLQQRASAAPQPPQVSGSPLPEPIDQQLQDFAARHRGRVWYDRGRAAVSFANDPLFEPGSDVVQPDAQRVLGELAGIAAQTPPEQFELIIVGHTDDTPISSSTTLAEHPDNWHLSVHRAIAIKNVLVSAGLPEARMGVMGYGPHRPLGNHKARNRRVEVFLARKGDVRPRSAVDVPAPTAP